MKAQKTTVLLLQSFSGPHTKRPKTKRPKGQNVPGTKRPKGQNVPKDKTSQGTKRPKGTNEAIISYVWPIT